jgi:ribonuclease HII
MMVTWCAVLLLCYRQPPGLDETLVQLMVPVVCSSDACITWCAVLLLCCRKPPGLDETPVELVVKGDATVTCIAAASVLAKVCVVDQALRLGN